MLDVKKVLSKLLQSTPLYSETTDASGVVTVTYRKYGRVVSCFVSSISSRSISGWGAISLGTIPNEFRPINSVGFLPITRQNVTNFIPVYLEAQSGGLIRLINQSGTTYTTGTIMANTYTWLTN